MAGSSIPFENLVVGRKYLITKVAGEREIQNELATLTRKIPANAANPQDQIEVILDRQPLTRRNSPYNLYEFRLAPFPTLRSLAAAEVKKQIGPHDFETTSVLENEERASRMGGRKRKHKTRKQKKRSRKTRRR